MSKMSVNHGETSETSATSKPDENQIETYSEVMGTDEELKEEEELEEEDFLNKNTGSFRCLTQVAMSTSSLMRNPFYFFPPLEDPGIDEAFNFVELTPPREITGVETYKRLCKAYEIVAISRITRCLGSEILDLSYYGLTTKQIRALSAALSNNIVVRELNLQDNWLTPEGVGYISNMLQENTTLHILNLRECRIGPEGALQLNPGIMKNQSLAKIDFSFNSLSNEGLENLKTALQENTVNKSLYLGHNNLDYHACAIMNEIFLENDAIQEIDLSWNDFNNNAGLKILCQGLKTMDELKVLNLSWTAIGAPPSVKFLVRLIKHAKSLEHLDLSSNRLSGRPLMMIRRALLGHENLITVRLGGNPMGPREGLSLAKLLLDKPKTHCLKSMDLENVFVTKDFLPIQRQILAQEKTIIIGGILSNYVIRGPDVKSLLFARAKYVAMKQKKKKRRKDFGHFILTLPDKRMRKEQFMEAIKKFKMKLDEDLKKGLMEPFMLKKDKVDIPTMKESYMERYPDTVLPPPKPKKKKKGRRKKKKHKVKEPETTQTETEGGTPRTEPEIVENPENQINAEIQTDIQMTETKDNQHVEQTDDSQQVTERAVEETQDVLT